MSSKAELEARARDWFGTNNTTSMMAVHLGRDAVALIQRERLWLYGEPAGPRRRPQSLALHITPTRRQALLKALGGDES